MASTSPNKARRKAARIPFKCRMCKLDNPADILRHQKYQCPRNPKPDVLFCHSCVKILSDDGSYRCHTKSLSHQRNQEKFDADVQSNSITPVSLLFLPAGENIVEEALDVYYRQNDAHVLPRIVSDCRERHRMIQACRQSLEMRCTIAVIFAECRLDDLGNDMILMWDEHEHGSLRNLIYEISEPCTKPVFVSRTSSTTNQAGTTTKPASRFPPIVLIPTLSTEDAPRISHLQQLIRPALLYVPITPVLSRVRQMKWCNTVVNVLLPRPTTSTTSTNPPNSSSSSPSTSQQKSAASSPSPALVPTPTGSSLTSQRKGSAASLLTSRGSFGEDSSSPRGRLPHSFSSSTLSDEGSLCDSTITLSSSSNSLSTLTSPSPKFTTISLGSSSGSLSAYSSSSYLAGADLSPRPSTALLPCNSGNPGMMSLSSPCATSSASASPLSYISASIRTRCSLASPISKEINSSSNACPTPSSSTPLSSMMAMSTPHSHPLRDEYEFLLTPMKRRKLSLEDGRDLALDLLYSTSTPPLFSSSGHDLSSFHEGRNDVDPSTANLTQMKEHGDSPNAQNPFLCYEILEQSNTYFNIIPDTYSQGDQNLKKKLHSRAVRRLSMDRSVLEVLPQADLSVTSPFLIPTTTIHAAPRFVPIASSPSPSPTSTPSPTIQPQTQPRSAQSKMGGINGDSFENGCGTGQVFEILDNESSGSTRVHSHDQSHGTKIDHTKSSHPTEISPSPLQSPVSRIQLASIPQIEPRSQVHEQAHIHNSQAGDISPEPSSPHGKQSQSRAHTTPHAIRPYPTLLSSIPISVPISVPLKPSSPSSSLTSPTIPIPAPSSAFVSPSQKLKRPAPSHPQQKKMNCHPSPSQHADVLGLFSSHSDTHNRDGDNEQPYIHDDQLRQQHTHAQLHSLHHPHQPQSESCTLRDPSPSTHTFLLLPGMDGKILKTTLLLASVEDHEGEHQHHLQYHHHVVDKSKKYAVSHDQCNAQNENENSRSMHAHGNESENENDCGNESEDKNLNHQNKDVVDEILMQDSATHEPLDVMMIAPTPPKCDSPLQSSPSYPHSRNFAPQPQAMDTSNRYTPQQQSSSLDKHSFSLMHSLSHSGSYSTHSQSHDDHISDTNSRSLLNKSVEAELLTYNGREHEKRLDPYFISTASSASISPLSFQIPSYYPHSSIQNHDTLGLVWTDGNIHGQFFGIGNSTFTSPSQQSSSSHQHYQPNNITPTNDPHTPKQNTHPQDSSRMNSIGKESQNDTPLHCKDDNDTPMRFCHPSPVLNNPITFQQQEPHAHRHGRGQLHQNHSQAKALSSSPATLILPRYHPSHSPSPSSTPIMPSASPSPTNSSFSPQVPPLSLSSSSSCPSPLPSFFINNSQRTHAQSHSSKLYSHSANPNVIHSSTDSLHSHSHSHASPISHSLHQDQHHPNQHDYHHPHTQHGQRDHPMSDAFSAPFLSTHLHNLHTTSPHFSHRSNPCSQSVDEYSSHPFHAIRPMAPVSASSVAPSKRLRRFSWPDLQTPMTNIAFPQ